MMEKFPEILGLVVSFALTSVVGVWVVPFLRRLKFGQEINDIGPTWHKSKEGTPTMGGMLFILGIVLGAVFGLFSFLSQSSLDPVSMLYISRLLSGLVMALAMGFVGFVDDYLKVVRKQNEGLSEWQKTILEFLVIAIYLWSLYLGGTQSTAFWVPFIGIWDVGFFYYPISAIILYATVNAVNFTDGIDGLCTVVTGLVAVAFLVFCQMMGLLLMGVLSAALLGGCLGFFLWNRNPAKVFMGDTGSLFLGGMVCALAFGINRPFILVFFGFTYIWESASVVIQRIYYKCTKKRLFKMTPIHHSFELSGYSENQIVFIFAAVTVVGCVLGLIAALYF